MARKHLQGRSFPESRHRFDARNHPLDGPDSGARTPLESTKKTQPGHTPEANGKRDNDLRRYLHVDTEQREPMMDPIEALPERWREKARTLAEYGDDRGAAVCRLHASELEAAMALAAEELLSPADAAEVAGVTERTLRDWKASGKIENHGTDTRPKYRRGDLPRRGNSDSDAGGGYDPAADAMKLAS